MIGQRVQIRTVPPPPPDFSDEFVRGGWRRIERLYNCRTDLALKWIDLCGGDELLAKRRAAIPEMRGVR